MINIINKEEIIEVYQSRICFEQGTKEITSDISLPLKMIDFLEKNKFIDSLVMNEDKSKIKISFHVQSSTLNYSNTSHFYMTLNVDDEKKETIFKIRFKTYEIQTFFNKILNNLYEVVLYHVFRNRDSFYKSSYVIKFYKNSFSLDPKAIVFKNKHMRIYENVSNYINYYHTKIQGLKADCLITQEVLDNLLLNGNYPKMNDVFLKEVLDLNERDFFINRFLIFARKKVNLLNLSFDEIGKYYDLVKIFEDSYFKEKLILTESIIINNQMTVEFETGIPEIYGELRFNITMEDNIESLKQKNLYIDNQKCKIDGLKVKDWIENKEEVKNIIRMLNY